MASGLLAGSAVTFVIVKKNGKVKSVGNNKYGELGSGDLFNRNRFPGKVKCDGHLFQSVSCGEYFTVMLEDNGSVWTTGCNEFGQLGLGDNIKRILPSKVQGMENIVAVSCGGNSTLLLDGDGAVWISGALKKVNNFQKLEGIPAILKIYAGELSLLLDENRKVWRLSVNQLTMVEELSEITEISCDNEMELYLDISGNVFFKYIQEAEVALDAIYEPGIQNLSNRFPYLPEIVGISAKESHIVLLDIDQRSRIRGTS